MSRYTELHNIYIEKREAYNRKKWRGQDTREALKELNDAGMEMKLLVIAREAMQARRVKQ